MEYKGGASTPLFPVAFRVWLEVVDADIATGRYGTQSALGLLTKILGISSLWVSPNQHSLKMGILSRFCCSIYSQPALVSARLPAALPSWEISCELIAN